MLAWQSAVAVSLRSPDDNKPAKFINNVDNANLLDAPFTSDTPPIVIVDEKGAASVVLAGELLVAIELADGTQEREASAVAMALSVVLASYYLLDVSFPRHFHPFLGMLSNICFSGSRFLLPKKALKFCEAHLV